MTELNNINELKDVLNEIFEEDKKKISSKNILDVLTQDEINWILKNQNRCSIVEEYPGWWGTAHKCTHLLIFHNKNGNCEISNCPC